MRLLQLLLTRAIRTPFSLSLLALLLSAIVPCTLYSASSNAPWDQPASALADQIASILGPGQAHLTLRNLSSISNDDLPAIRRILEQDLRSHGITSSGDEAANQLRITLSENAREHLWVAEIIEGNETRVVMVSFNLARPTGAQSTSGLTLHKQPIFASREQILFALEVPEGLIILEPEQIRIYAHSPAGWDLRAAIPIHQKRPLSRDARGILLSTNNGQSFEAWLPGETCDGSSTGSPAQWSIHCRESDDPWPIPASALMQIGSAPAPPLKAFYNAARDYYTGIVAPSLGADLPAFYTASWFPRAQAPALLLNSLDGKLQLVESAALKPIAGARDWGSDFAALQSACGFGTQIVASASGPAAQDSLRAYEIPSLEAIPASPPLAMSGSVTALWTATGGRGLLAVVRTISPSDQAIQYEVDRVTASCN